MTFRTNAIALTIAVMAMPAALAQSAATFVGGEAGWIDRAPPSSLTREQVGQELQAFRGNPVLPDGGIVVGGEAGYMFPAHSYARVNGEWVCTDKIAHNARPDAIRSDAERTSFLRQYPA